MPSMQQLHVRGGAAALTTSLLVSVGLEGCVFVASLEENELLGIVGGWGKRGGDKVCGAGSAGAGSVGAGAGCGPWVKVLVIGAGAQYGCWVCVEVQMEKRKEMLGRQ